MHLPKALLALACLLTITTAWGQQSQERLQTLAEQGQAALQAGRYAEASQAYQELSRLQPGVAEIHVTLGVISFKQGDFSKAAAEYRKALHLKPALPRVDSLLAMALSEQGEFEQALPGLEKGFRQTTDTDLRRMCGLRLERAFTSLGKGSAAVQVAIQLQQTYPNDPEVLYYSGKIFGNEAYLAAQRLFQVAPDSLWGRMAMGEAHESEGNFDQALQNYGAVLQLDPNRPNVHFRMGRVLLARGEAKGNSADLEEAAKQFQLELQADPSNANAAYELAEGYRKQGKFEDARHYFEQAVENYPSFEEAHVGLAATLLAQQHPELALIQLQKAVELRPDDPVAWYRLSQVQRRLGNTEEQKHALAEFTRLRASGASKVASSGSEITPQQLDPADKP
ncbi:MAG: tetratricopeptide repeat protein [Acidobacteriaceae bacterium]